MDACRQHTMNLTRLSVNDSGRSCEENENMDITEPTSVATSRQSMRIELSLEGEDRLVNEAHTEHSRLCS